MSVLCVVPHNMEINATCSAQAMLDGIRELRKTLFNAGYDLSDMLFKITVEPVDVKAAIAKYGCTPPITKTVERAFLHSNLIINEEILENEL